MGMHMASILGNLHTKHLEAHHHHLQHTHRPLQSEVTRFPARVMKLVALRAGWKPQVSLTLPLTLGAAAVYPLGAQRKQALS